MAKGARQIIFTQYCNGQMTKYTGVLVELTRIDEHGEVWLVKLPSGHTVQRRITNLPYGIPNAAQR